MSFRLLNRIQNVFFAVFIVSLFILLNLSFGAQKEITLMHQNQELAMKVIDDMRISSDRLTMMARLYLETGDKKYRKYYFDIINIRQGRIPKPDNYDATYWDRVLSGETVISKSNNFESLNDEINKLKIPKEEYELILLSESKSERLSEFELQAFLIIEEISKTEEQKIIKKQQATEILYGHNYMLKKDGIMKPLRECEVKIQERIHREIYSLEERQSILLNLSVIITILAGLIILVFRIMIDYYLIRPLKILNEQSKQIADGDFNVRNRLFDKYEIGTLGKLINKMLDVIEEDRQKFIELSFVDGLTGIANRRKFDEYYNSIWELMKREKRCLSIIMLDIDHFKKYNDYYGHKAGDQCLIKVAQTISNTVKREVDLVARYGGEEFVCLLPDTDLSGAKILAEQIRKNIKELKVAHEASPDEKVVTISAGVSCFCLVDKDSEYDLINVCDKALYEAKKSGRNKVVSSARLCE